MAGTDRVERNDRPWHQSFDSRGRPPGVPRHPSRSPSPIPGSAPLPRVREPQAAGSCLLPSRTLRRPMSSSFPGLLELSPKMKHVPHRA